MQGTEDEPADSVCPCCGKPVDPDAAGVIFAREIVAVPSVEGLPRRLEGRGAFFHVGCPPELIGWARRARRS